MTDERDDDNLVINSDFKRRDVWEKPSFGDGTEVTATGYTPSDEDRKANVLEGKFTFWVGKCPRCGLGYGTHREVLTATPDGGEQAVAECPRKS